MKNYGIFKIIAPMLVVLGIGLIIISIDRLIDYFGHKDLFLLLNFMPKWVIQFVGMVNMIVFLPIFVLGFANLRSDGAIGKATVLCIGSVYKYVRNPMYAGLSFTVFGAGVFIGSTAIVMAGIGWLAICFMVTRWEERDLERRFGKQYLYYKQITPRFIPDFKKIFKGLIIINDKNKNNKKVVHG